MNDTPADYRRMAFIEKQGKLSYGQVNLSRRYPWQESVREGIWLEWDTLGPALLGADEHGTANKKKTLC